MDYFASLAEAENLDRSQVRSAVVLAKLRYDQQLAPFVRTSKSRYESNLVQNEINRIVFEVSKDLDVDAEKVGSTLRKIVLADVATTAPKKETLETVKTFGDDTYGEGAPSGKNDTKDPELDGIEKTDIADKDAVLEDKILKADDQIDITKPLNSQSCVRCGKVLATVNDLVCQVCNDAIVSLAKKKEAIAPDINTNVPSQPAGTNTNVPSQPATTQAPTHLMPLNPNAPYQCTVCGRTGTWDELNQHIQNALDVPHMTAKQQLQMQDQQATQMQPQAPQTAPQQPAAYHGHKTSGEYEEQQDQDAAVEDEHAESPSSHFDDVIQLMANRAAARHFSAAGDQDIQQIAQAYGLDANAIKQSIQGVAVFGNFHGSNGVIGQSSGVPEGYTEVDLDNNGAGIQSHEAVVPVNIAIKKVSEDLGMDPNTVYSAVKDAYGGDLSDEYHVSVQGEFHYYLPKELMDKATSHPQPPAPDQNQQQQPQGPPGVPPQMQAQPQMNLPQPDMNQMQYASKFILNNQQLEVLLNRDGQLADQRLLMRK